MSRACRQPEVTAMIETPGQTEIPELTEIVLHLSRDEAALMVAALRMLRSTLGREEAEELAEVQAILAKLESA
jgi:hypothetical protein